MHCDIGRERGMRILSGIVEGSRRIAGLRLKRAGSRRTLKGANAMPAIKCSFENMRRVDFMDRKTGMARTA